MKTFRIYLMLIFAVTVLQACSNLLVPNIKTELAALREGQYTLDPKHTAVLFKVGHMGFSKFVGRFEKVEASLDFDAEDIENSQLQAIIDMQSVNVNDERFSHTLTGSKWFNTEEFPQATFVSKSALRSENNTVLFAGDLSFMGVTKAVTVEVTFNGGANNVFNNRYTIGFEAHSQFKRSDFGLDKYLSLVSDEVAIEVHAEFMRIR